MSPRAFLGVDIGTSSSKGVLVDPSGRLMRSTSREHSVSRPRPGHVEMDAAVWWSEFVSIAEELTSACKVEVTAIGVSGMGPCVLITDESGKPLRPAILYGVDTRATSQIKELNGELGADHILHRCGSALSSQAVGPKLRWLAEEEPEIFSRAHKLFMPASWLAYRLTGEYLLDFHSASQCTPMFDINSLDWYRPWAEGLVGAIDLPPLLWAMGQAGKTCTRIGGIPPGTPVAIGSIDAWSEATSIGAHNPGDLMLMYGTTMFLVATVKDPIFSPTMWGTAGALPCTRSLAGGMATSGAITFWLRDLFGSPDYPTLQAEAADAGPGANGLLMLPYFAGERTPIFDPHARGAIVGLTTSHTRGDLYRAALEATALGVRHNVEVMCAAGVSIDRVFAVGGGTQGGIWTQIVSDITGLTQIIPTVTIGASYGAAYFAACLVDSPDISHWNPMTEIVTPDPEQTAQSDELYQLFRQLHPAILDIEHKLALRQLSAV